MLQVIARPGTDRRLGRGRHYLAEAINSSYSGSQPPFPRQIQQGIWGLVARGLAYIDITQSAPENWSLELTAAGAAALKDEAYNPDDPSGYLSRLYADVPGLAPLAKQYVEEALSSYYHQVYLSSTVMLGVAAEAIFLDVAAEFAGWVGGNTGQNLTKSLQSPKVAYVRKFEEFRKRLLSASPKLPNNLSDGLDLQLNAVLDLLRVNRNQAGHPTGVRIERDDAFVNLRMFARLAHRMYELKAFFSTP